MNFPSLFRLIKKTAAQSVSEFLYPGNFPETEPLQPRRDEFKDPDLEDNYRQSRFNDHLYQLRILIIIAVVCTAYFVPSDFLFYGWGERTKWLLLVRSSYIAICIAFLIYSFRLPADRLSRVAIFWLSISVLSQLIIATNRPPMHIGNFVVELVVILLIYLLLPVSVRLRFYAAGLFTLFWFLVLFFVREQQPQGMVRALVFSAILANFMGVVISYRHERLDRIKFYLLWSVETARTKLAQSNAELDAFSHTVAHDLKTPVNAMIGDLSLLREEINESADTVSLTEIVDLVEKAANRQQRIVDELLLLANIRKMGGPPMRSVNMEALLRGSIDLLQTEMQKAGATVAVVDPLPEACGHWPWIEQVWVNYLTNAIRYGGKSPRIECGGCIENGFGRFWVRDHGPGVPNEEQNRLFTEFTRLNQAKAGGHGLGLSVVRRIVDALGGRVGVTSPEDGGSEFWFTLPLRCANDHKNDKF